MSAVAVVQTITHPNDSLRIDIFRRDDGTFGYVERERIVDEYGGGWGLLDDSGMVADTLETALAEVRGRVPWARDLQPNDAAAEPEPPSVRASVASAAAKAAKEAGGIAIGRLIIIPGDGFGLAFNLSPRAAARFNLAVIVAWVALGLLLVALTERVATRYAPAAGEYTIGLLVLFCWASQLMPFLKGRRSLLGAVWDGLRYAVLFGALAILGFRYTG
jgi:hypothetical protein